MKLSTLVTTLTLSLALMTTAKLRATDFIHFDTPLYKYRVYLTDKKGTPYSVKRPEQFLSQKSIERRKRLKLKVDKHDLPLTPAYVDGIRAKGLRVVNKSKWNNTLVVETTDSTLAQSLTTLPYVKSVRRVYTRPDSIAAPDTTDRHSRLTGKLDSTANYYGHGYGQIEMLNGLRLHDAGLRGQGMTIAVIDGGFYNADILPGLKGTRILGTRNFVNDDPDVYAAHWHGMAVLSCIGARAPYSLVGTAPEASFYLLMSEDTPTEHMVEEDNWCAAVEYADSLGVDIITSSLGYYTYDDPAESHTYRELDGPYRPQQLHGFARRQPRHPGAQQRRQCRQRPMEKDQRASRRDRHPHRRRCRQPASQHPLLLTRQHGRRPHQTRRHGPRRGRRGIRSRRFHHPRQRHVVLHPYPVRHGGLPVAGLPRPSPRGGHRRRPALG